MGDDMGLEDGMGFVRLTMSALVVFAVIAAGTARANAEERLPTCHATSVEQARTLADRARRDGQHRLAASCYRQAGDFNAADRSQAEAFVQTGTQMSKKAAATIDDAKEKAKRIREAFRARPRAQPPGV